MESWPVILQAVAMAMDAEEPAIHSAMDGLETASVVESNGTVSKRTEPVVFFYVVFGLVYEALAAPSSETVSAALRQRIIIAALQALKSLVNPKYAGNALSEPTAFDELISLFYRIAMTETAAIQIHLIRVATALATSQDQQSKAAGNLR